LFGAETPNHRPEREPRSPQHQHDQQPRRRAESLVQPDTSEREKHEGNGELQSDTGELAAGYAFTLVKQPIVFGLLFLL
jgi:hypothetical protein